MTVTPTDHVISVMCEGIDRLTTIEIRNGGLPTGKIAPLYAAARADAGDTSPTLNAALALSSRVSAGDRVLFLTGAGAPPTLPQGENDGPPGAAAVARAIYWGLNAIPVYVSEQRHHVPIVAASEAAGVMIRDYETASEYRLGGSAFTAPLEQEKFSDWASDLLDKISPVAIVTIELMGVNKLDILHNVTGHSGWSPSLKWSALFDEAAARGILSIGIGDGGNEVGMGRIVETTRAVQDYGAECQCPCGGGMATVEQTDHLIVAGVSNWGGYALEAALALVIGQQMESPEIAEKVISDCTDAGALESVYCTKQFSVDGTPGAVSTSLVRVMEAMVNVGLAEPDIGLAH